jgi:hypothetical protein
MLSTHYYFFYLKIKNITLKYQNTPDDPGNYPKNRCENTKIPQMLTLFFVLSKAKTILLLYMNNEKTKKILVQQPNNILILEEKKIFLLFKNL